MNNISSYQRLFSPQALLPVCPTVGPVKRYQSFVSLGSPEQQPALAALKSKLSEKQENYINAIGFTSTTLTRFNRFIVENHIPIKL